MRAPVELVDLSALADAGALYAEIRRERAAPVVIVHDGSVPLDGAAIDALVSALDSPMAATSSPVPVAEASERSLAVIEPSELLPPPPSLPFACGRVSAVSVGAIASVPLPPTTVDDSLAGFDALCDSLTKGGWRHVAAPGLALSWDPSERATPAWGRSWAVGVAGAANEGLMTHRLWARTRLRSVSVVIDGACITDAIHNGSQAVVINIARSLAAARPSARVRLAVSDPHRAAAQRAVGAGVEVVERGETGERADVAYRPYQPLAPGDLDWLVGAADRLVVAQLDMIAFSNPSYHLAPHFHAVRNLQRWTMRHADAVTFISRFGLESAYAECPDLEPSRLFVTSCGADPVAPDSPRPDGGVRELAGPDFLACLSATFSHKNRQHAIAVFDELCRTNGYEGRLVVAGPEPYYGRSTDDDERLLAGLDVDVRRRVVRLGRVDDATKWWLLGAARLVLYPSIIEGFGLVPFEAAAVDTPSLSHCGSAIAEVLGAGAATVDDWDPGSWAAAAARIIDDSGARDQALEAVRHAARGHTWERSAALTWNVFDAVVARPRASLVSDEGGFRSRMSGQPGRLAVGAKVTHFGNRVVGVVERTVRSRRPGS